jgi:hypothetical protein
MQTSAAQTNFFAGFCPATVAPAGMLAPANYNTGYLPAGLMVSKTERMAFLRSFNL